MSKVQLKRGEIYFVDLGETEGSEVRKVRPCVIIQNDIGNRYAPTTIVIPISNRSERNLPTQLLLDNLMMEESTTQIKGIAMTEQIRTVDRCRILTKAGKLNQAALNKIDQAILVSMGISLAM